MNRSIAIRVAAVAMLVALSFAPMDAGQARGKGKGKQAIGKMIERLELTADQQARIAAIRDAFKAQNAALIEEMKGVHEQIREARRGGDRARAEQLRTQSAQRAEQLKAAREQMRQQVLAVLTAGQRAELDAMREKRKEKREKGIKGAGREKGAKRQTIE